jgi:hypothetical protein
MAVNWCGNREIRIIDRDHGCHLGAFDMLYATSFVDVEDESLGDAHQLFAGDVLPGIRLARVHVKPLGMFRDPLTGCGEICWVVQRDRLPVNTRSFTLPVNPFFARCNLLF